MKRPCTRNNKGVVDVYRQPKLAYRTVKEAFTKPATLGSLIEGVLRKL
jgi:hypothetical protein